MSTPELTLDEFTSRSISLGQRVIQFMEADGERDIGIATATLLRLSAAATQTLGMDALTATAAFIGAYGHMLDQETGTLQ